MLRANATEWNLSTTEEERVPSRVHLEEETDERFKKLRK